MCLSLVKPGVRDVSRTVAGKTGLWALGGERRKTEAFPGAFDDLSEAGHFVRSEGGECVSHGRGLSLARLAA